MRNLLTYSDWLLEQTTTLKIGDEITVDGKNMLFSTSKFGSYGEVQKSNDPEGLTVFWYLVQDIKCFVLSLVNAHFRVSRVLTKIL